MSINPKHYKSHPSGVECIQITEHMNFNIGNAIKYLWRHELKQDCPIEDLRKASWYIQREILRIENGKRKDTGFSLPEEMHQRSTAYNVQTKPDK